MSGPFNSEYRRQPLRKARGRSGGMTRKIGRTLAMQVELTPPNLSTITSDERKRRRAKGKAQRQARRVGRQT